MTPDISSLIPRFGELFENTLVTWSKNFEPTSHGEPGDGQTTRFSVEAGATESTSKTALLQEVVASEGGVEFFCHPPEHNSCSGGREGHTDNGPRMLQTYRRFGAGSIGHPELCRLGRHHVGAGFDLAGSTSTKRVQATCLPGLGDT